MNQQIPRKHERHELVEQAEGHFTLRTARDVHHRINGIRDISDSGASFFIDREIPLRAKIAIEYEGPGMRLEVEGTVAWCLPADKVPNLKSADLRGSHVVGVELFSPALLRSCLPRR